MKCHPFTGLIRFLYMSLFVTFTHTAFSQEDLTEKTYHFNGNVSITNNGFSLIPTFSLGKPAALAELSIGGNRFSFDPQFRFDLDGLKPWSFIFIWRYKMIQTEKFQMRIGAHLPAISFQERTIQVNGSTRQQVIPYRFFTPELIPTYTISKNISVGAYYIWGIGLEKEDQTKNTQFVALRAYFNDIRLNEQFRLTWHPQIYYLSLDGTDGIYAAQSLALAHEKIPFSISSMMNVKLQSDIDTKDFAWTISLVYTFKNQYKKAKRS